MRRLAAIATLVFLLAFTLMPLTARADRDGDDHDKGNDPAAKLTYTGAL